MAPANHGVIAQLISLIYYNLDNNLLKNAVFFAGRLHGLEPRSSEAAYLVSTCHLRLGEIKAAYDYSKTAGSRGSHLGCSYVFAQACLALDRFAEGLSALEKSRALWTGRNCWNKHGDSRRQSLPDAAAVFCLMGKICQAYRDKPKAVDNYTAALKLNPFMWDAFLGLCDMGVNVRVHNVFKMTPEMMSSSTSGAHDDHIARPPDDPPPLNIATKPPTNLIIPSHDPFNSVSIPANADLRKPIKAAPLNEKLNGSSSVSITPISNVHESQVSDSFETPVGPSSSTSRGKEVAQVLDESTQIEPPLAPARKLRPASTISADLGSDVSRLKASTVRTRLQNRAEPEESDGNIQTWNPSGLADRKRNASGQVTKTSVASTRSHAVDTTAAAAQQRRSTRLSNLIRPASKASAASVHLSARESLNEIKRTRTVGSRGAIARPTASRTLSGTRRNGDAMDVDGKDARAIGAAAAGQVGSQKSAAAAGERSKDQEALRYLLDLFTRLASGYFCLSTFRCDEALHIFKNIPDSQRETPWVLAQMGKTLYEQAKYAEAERYFSRVRAMCPSRLEDLEIYSTILWQMKAEVSLAYLAHEITEADRLSPQAWCAVGNSLSLERNHEGALVAFKRATQIDPKFAYAWTLQGYEHIANEEYDKAMEAFRNGIEADNRHYNAWYGMGRVFERQGKYDMAEAHYRFASMINPTNAILIGCIGGVLELMKRPQLALDQYTRSCELAPKNILSRFKKARVLMSLNMWDRALADLLILKDIAPDEANVHFQLGRTYKTLRMKGEAIKHFTAALNLDPKASHHIKEAMEQMEEDYDDDDDGDMA